MKTEELMTRDVRTCGPDDRLNAAAHIMWDRDCGCVPVVEQADGAARVVGMLTDRDVCMAAYTQGRPLEDITVRSAMSKEVCACRCTDPLETAVKTLEEHQIRRLPVLDEGGRLMGMLSLADIACEAEREHGRIQRDVSDDQVAEALEVISRPRPQGMQATPA